MTAQSWLHTWAEARLRPAGITINGPNPWDMQVHNTKLYGYVMGFGPRGLGEAYMYGWWNCEQLDEFIARLLRAQVHAGWQSEMWNISLAVMRVLTNMQSVARSRIVGTRHYDVGNDLFERMLDPHMMYSCAYYGRGAANLNDAQEDKLRLTCEKLQLARGMRVLDIGCGWGGFARFAAERYGVEVVGLTISEEQAVLAREWCKGLPVSILFKDYRELPPEIGLFDRIVSIGMFEHVGPKYYRIYMEIAEKHLKERGLFLLHSIGGHGCDPWFNKYIFPGGVLPAEDQIRASLKGLFHIWDWHNFGRDYDPTLLAWYANFERAWPELQEKYGERFFRMWRYYLLGMAGGFRAEEVKLWQILLAKQPARSSYAPVR
ncbi:MAG: cyclopropane fatty acyl phospholipid synthase [Patescibacteria group bacterium]